MTRQVYQATTDRNLVIKNGHIVTVRPVNLLDIKPAVKIVKPFQFK